MSFFKLRPDKHYFFNSDRTAFVGYRVEAGTLLLSGDPVGPPEALGDLLLEVRRFAQLARAQAGGARRQRGAAPDLRRGSVCARSISATRRSSTRARFSLEGRPIRKVRQSVTRLRKAGYSSQLCTLAEIDDDTRSRDG